MTWTPIYADERDFELILSWLNDENEIAYLVSNGEKKWIAKESINISSLDLLKPYQYSLWHIPSGPLPLLGKNNNEPDSTVENPWEGWTERREGINYPIPYFGPGHPGVITLTIKVKGEDSSNSIGLSDFGWIGNHYRIIGRPAHPTTEKWWQRLKRWIKKNAIRIPRSGPVNGSSPEIWTFASALSKIESGIPRDINP